MELMGYHISALLLRMFVMYFPLMIENGMVYKAVPPLFSISTGKTKVKDPRTNKMVTRDKKRYFTEQIDIVRYNQRLFMKENNIMDMKKKPLSTKDITLFFMKNLDYIFYLEEELSRTYGNAYLIEMILNHYLSNGEKINVSKLDKEVKSAFRFMGVTKHNGIPVVSGTIDESNFIVINDKFLEDSLPLIDIMKSNSSLYYNVNGKKMTIYDIMKIYKSITPKEVQRYKGLGEMEDWELAESTLFPGSDRTLIRYTLDDAIDEINGIREYESNNKKILELVGKVTRDDLME